MKKGMQKGMLPKSLKFKKINNKNLSNQQIKWFLLKEYDLQVQTKPWKVNILRAILKWQTFNMQFLKIKSTYQKTDNSLHNQTELVYGFINKRITRMKIFHPSITSVHLNNNSIRNNKLLKARTLLLI